MNEETKDKSDAELITDDEMLDEYDFSQAIRGNPYMHLSQAPIKIITNTGDQDIQIKTVEVSAIVAIDGKVTLQLPPEITPGNHRITLLIQKTLTPQMDGLN
jgi:hypothetical protein